MYCLGGYLKTFNRHFGAGVIRELTTLSEDLGSVPSTHMDKDTCSSGALFWPSGVHACVYTYTVIHKYT